MINFDALYFKKSTNYMYELNLINPKDNYFLSCNRRINIIPINKTLFDEYNNFLSYKSRINIYVDDPIYNSLQQIISTGKKYNLYG